MSLLRTIVHASVAALCMSGVALPAQLPYEFTVDASASGLAADLSLSLATDGTLIGDYDPDQNPGGTRTKPGLFGPFGPTENAPVDASLGFGLGASPDTSTAGGFRMDVDTALNLAEVSELTLNLLASGPAVATATIALEYGSFRTRNPDALFPGDIPIELPIGQASITELTATQVGVAPGTIIPRGGDEYEFVALVLASMEGSAEFLGNEVPIPETPVTLPLSGTLVLAGETAHLSSMQPLELAELLEPGQELPTLPLDVPTILPPGDTAHLLFDLTLEEVMASMDGTLTTEAEGVLIPEPGSIGLLLWGAVVLLRRR